MLKPLPLRKLLMSILHQHAAITDFACDEAPTLYGTPLMDHFSTDVARTIDSAVGRAANFAVLPSRAVGLITL